MLDTLREDIASVIERDPSVHSAVDVIFWHTGMHAVWAYRRAHWLWEHGAHTLASLVSRHTRKRYGVEIHPAAQIGRRFMIDHGMGIVIGETAEVGDDCLIYHGVTLGGTGKDQGKRHPTIGNNVLLSTGSKVLGPFKVGDGARIAANAVVLKEIPENATAVGVPARVVRIAGEKANFVGNVDQVNVTDPVQKELEAINARLTWLENYLDRTHQPEEKKDRKENQHEAV